MEIEKIKELYEAERPKYERLTKSLHDLLKKLFDQADIPIVYIGERTKKVSSLIDSIQRKRYSNLDQLEDASGLRVVVLRRELVPRVLEVLRAQFELVKERDASAELGSDKMGYRSKHLIIKLRTERLALPEWCEFRGLHAEVQVLTELEDVFARTGRELRHKLESSIPLELDRNLNMLSTVLENADMSLSNIWSDWRKFLEEDRDRLVRELGSEPTAAALKRLRDVSERLHTYHRRDFAERHLRLEVIREHPSLYSYLEHHFMSQPVTIAGSRIKLMRRNLPTGPLVIPVAVVWAGDVRLSNLATQSVRENPNWSRSPFIRDQILLDRVVGNNLTFEARSIALQPDHVEISGGLTTYASSLIAQDGLEAELLSAAASTFSPGDNYNRFSDLSACLTDRSIVEAGGDPLEGPHRFNAIAISTLIVAPGEDGEALAFYQRRSRKTAAHAGLFHLIPAAMFQPEITFPKPKWDPTRIGEASQEWDWKLNVVREYGEELFSECLASGVTSIDRITPTTPHTYALAQALMSNSVLLKATGLVINVLNFRPEICTVLLINDLDLWREERRHFKLNFEHEQADPESPESALRSLRLSTFESDFVEQCGSTAGMWVPPGLAALWLGVEFVKSGLTSK